MPIFVSDKVVKNQVPGVAVFQPGGARRVADITVLKIDQVIGIGGGTVPLVVEVLPIRPCRPVPLFLPPAPGQTDAFIGGRTREPRHF